jgi:transposase
MGRLTLLATLDQAGTLWETHRGRQKVDDQAGPERVYSEIGRLKMELDWLKNMSEVSL